jgi:Txe/YoeB family toxin of Txe-Axe toxin-antitoxin module
MFEHHFTYQRPLDSVFLKNCINLPFTQHRQPESQNVEEEKIFSRRITNTAPPNRIYTPQQNYVQGRSVKYFSQCILA